MNDTNMLEDSLSTSYILGAKTDIESLRKDFPLLKKPIYGKRLAYLDSAATTQKPQIVIDSMSHYYENFNANVHRGVYHLSAVATEAFEAARKTVQQFINAKEASECIFVKSTTEAINLVATSFGAAFITEGSEILISMMEHHANIVPWQMLAERSGAKLRYIPMDEKGELILSELDNLLNEKTKLVAISHVSNALGTLHPIREIIAKAHALHIPVLVDGAQSAPHLAIDVQALDCDFFTFSGHKTYGPTGIGVLYGKSHWLDRMPPYQGGGEMIKEVRLKGSTYQDLPFKFEAGTPAIAEAIGLQAALQYLMALDLDALHQHERELKHLAKKALLSFPGIKLIGNPIDSLGILSFTLKGVHPHDIGTLLDQQGVAVRTGHHCAMPIMEYFGLAATTRISLGLYNCKKDIEQLTEALHYVQKVFKLGSL